MCHQFLLTAMHAANSQEEARAAAKARAAAFERGELPAEADAPALAPTTTAKEVKKEAPEAPEAPKEGTKVKEVKEVSKPKPQDEPEDWEAEAEKEESKEVKAKEAPPPKVEEKVEPKVEPKEKKSEAPPAPTGPSWSRTRRGRRGSQTRCWKGFRQKDSRSQAASQRRFHWPCRCRQINHLWKHLVFVWHGRWPYYWEVQAGSRRKSRRKLVPRLHHGHQWRRESEGLKRSKLGGQLLRLRTGASQFWMPPVTSPMCQTWLLVHQQLMLVSCSSPQEKVSLRRVLRKEGRLVNMHFLPRH